MLKKGFKNTQKISGGGWGSTLPDPHPPLTPDASKDLDQTGICLILFCDSKLLSWRTLAMNGYMTSCALFYFLIYLLIGAHEVLSPLRFSMWIILNHRLEYTRQMPRLIQVFCSTNSPVYRALRGKPSFKRCDHVENKWISELMYHCTPLYFFLNSVDCLHLSSFRIQFHF